MSVLYWYKAIPRGGGGAASDPRRGELAAESPALARAALRRAGLQVLDIGPVRVGVTDRFWPGAQTLRRALRRRRGPAKAEMLDSLATMLDAGMPLLEGLQTLAGDQGGRSSSRHRLAASLRESLRSGSPLAESMRRHPGWFDEAECAMVESAEIAGTLPRVLLGLSQRLERSGELAARLAAALAYPCIVAGVGVGVVVFLSTVTLPKLVGVLTEAHVPTPRLTSGLVWVGQTLTARWPVILAGLVGAALAASALGRLIAARAPDLAARLRRLVPSVVRRIAVARFALGMSELLRAGIPAVEALRVLPSTVSGVGAAGLRAALGRAADEVERGASLAAALDDGVWFDTEFRRLVAIGEASGELETQLERLGSRYERRARRLIERLAALLEPAVIVTLAALVGLVVMAAVLPLIRLQEVIR